MKLAFTTLACPAWTVARVVGAAVANRYDAIDFRGCLDAVELFDSPHFKGEGLLETAARVADAGLAVSCLGSSAKMAVPDAAARAAELDAMRRYAELCAPLGCRGHRGPRLRRRGDARRRRGNRPWGRDRVRRRDP